MKENTREINSTMPETTDVCYYTEHYCRNCKYFDSHYHGGYCDRYKQDVNAYDDGCRQWWWNGN